MVLTIKLSDDVATKLVSGLFKELNTTWFITNVRWVIDSKYRTSVWLDKFLFNQVWFPNDDVLTIADSLRDTTPDKTIIRVLKYVKENITYKTDVENYGKAEYWATASDILVDGEDDCDGINSLIYVLARLAGVPSYLLYNAIGDTPLGGHYWLVYLSNDTHKLYSIDGTYHPDITPIEDRASFRIGSKYQKIWYLFNEARVFKQW